VISRTHLRLERFFYVFVCAILLLVMMYWAQAVFLPVMMAVFLTFVLSPPAGYLERKGVPRVVAVLTVALLLFVLILCFFGFFYYQVKGLVNDLPVYEEQIHKKLESLRETTEWMGTGRLFEFFDELKKDPAEVFQAEHQGEAGRSRTQSLPLPIIQSVAGTMLHALVNIALVFLLLLFMLMQREDLRDRLIRLSGDKHLTRATLVFDEASARISRYLAMQLLVNIGVGVTLGLGLFLIGVPYALVWGVIGAVSRYIPYLGAWIAAVLPLAVSFAVMPGWTPFFLSLGLIAFIELVTGNVIEPVLFGHSIGVTSLALLIATVFWTWLWGPLGLLLATPLTAYLVVLGRHVPALESFSLLMGDESTSCPHLTFFERMVGGDTDEGAALIDETMQKQPVEKIYDEVVIPALNHALVEKEHGLISDEDDSAFIDSTRAVLKELVWDSPSKPAENADADAEPVAIFGFRGRQEHDALVLDLFKESTGGRMRNMETFAWDDAEARSRLPKDKPGLILIVAWSYQGLMDARRLCKQIRATGSTANIVACCWGHERDPAQVRDKLINAGADAVGTTFAETREQLRGYLTPKRSEATPQTIEVAAS
jgi:predicted PurR-regulated permease PerM